MEYRIVESKPERTMTSFRQFVEEERTNVAKLFKGSTSLCSIPNKMVKNLFNIVVHLLSSMSLKDTYNVLHRAQARDICMIGTLRLYTYT